MDAKAPKLPHPSPSTVTHEGRSYPLLWESAGWRLRSRSRKFPADFRTGSLNLKTAQARAREWLAKNAGVVAVSRKGGGKLSEVAKLYLATPKRAKTNVAEDNVSALKVICRTVLGKELAEVTCKEVGPDLWQAFQRARLTQAGHKFDLSTRYRENVAINSRVRCARCLFLPALLRVYAAAGLDVPTDAGAAQMLPEPYVAPTVEDDGKLVKAWEALASKDRALWLVIGIARFAGLRRQEIANMRGGWIECEGDAVLIALRDRPEEKWWSKTGRPYRALVIEPALADWLRAARETVGPGGLVVPSPSTGDDRDWWFERAPQEWLHALGVSAKKPLHRLRGLYADQLAKLTEQAIIARQAGVKAAQEALGHSSEETTKKHYLTP